MNRKLFLHGCYIIRCSQERVSIHSPVLDCILTFESQFPHLLLALSDTSALSSQQRHECSVHEPSCWSSLRTPDGRGHGHVDLSQLQHASRIISCGCSISPGSSSAAAGSILSAASAVKLQLTAALRWIDTIDRYYRFPVVCSFGLSCVGVFTFVVAFGTFLGSWSAQSNTPHKD